jgi:hypothetical protein
VFNGGITTGPDGAIWFTAEKGDEGQIGRLSTSGSYTWFGGLSAPRPGYSGPVDITAAPPSK